MTRRKAHKLWTEKYRPATIDHYVFHDALHKGTILDWLEQKSIPNILLHGTAGSGKTTLARILTNSLDLEDTDILELNASDENSVDVIREKIRNFALTFAMGPFKVVLLEEADYISLQGQAILRKLMEDYSEHTRFILTCNYVHKIIPAVRSRCQELFFKTPDKNEVTELVANILVHEKIKFTLSTLDKYIAFGYPDIRKIINYLQQNSINGTLQDPQQEGTTGDYKFALIDLIERNKWEQAREVVCGNVTAEEWEDLYKFLYEFLDKSPKFQIKEKWEEGIIIIADHLYKHSIVADPEINAAAMFIKLTKI